MRCGVCQRKRQWKTVSRLLVEVRFVVNYQTGTAVTFEAGTLICADERRVIFQATSEGQAIRLRHNGRVYREDGRQVFEPAKRPEQF
jgi:hypothetical protein